MSRLQREENLRQLEESLTNYGRTNGINIPNLPHPEADLLSKSFFLAHSTTDESFSEICRSNQVLSPTWLAKMRGEVLRPDSAEAILDTGNSVFLYAGPFRFPRTSCGLLFSISLEKDNREDGIATPFDSGGLVQALRRPNPAEPLRTFLSRHELPVPDHRDYLRQTLDLLFDRPVDYLEGREPRWPGPIGLAGGDDRRWTHEVRIPDRVFVKSAHLQAAFARTALVASDPAVENLQRWCHLQGVDFIPFPTPRGDGFATLQRECIDYVRRKLLS